MTWNGPNGCTNCLGLTFHPQPDFKFPHLQDENLYRKEEKELKQNDALSYLDSVREHFKDSPVKYNSFLDVMKDFKKNACVSVIPMLRLSIFLTASKI